MKPSLRVLLFKFSGKLVSFWKSIPLAAPVKTSIAIAIPGLALVGLVGLSSADTLEFTLNEKTSAKKGKSLKGKVMTDDNVLQAIQLTPEGEISQGDERKEIFVAFNHPIVPLSALDEQVKGIFTISPPLKGKFRWYGSRICAFVPQEDIQEGKIYTVKIQESLKALNGKAFTGKRQFSFSLKIPPVTVVSLEPHNYRPVKYRDSFSLTLNFPVDNNTLKNNTSLEINGSPVAYNIKKLKQEDSGYSTYLSGSRYRKYHTYKIIPSEIMPRSARIKFTIKKGMKADKINTALAETYIREYTTYGDFTFKEAVSPKKWGERYSSEIHFSNPVSPKELKRSIKVSPKVTFLSNFSGVKEINSISINSWDIKPGTRLRFQINSMKDVMGNILKNPGSFTIELPDREAYFSLGDYGKVIERKMAQKIPLEISNISDLTVDYASFGISEVLESLGSNKSISALVSFKEKSIKTNVKKNVFTTLFYDVSNLNSPKDNWGVYSFSDKNKGSGTSVAQITDLGITARTAHNGIHIWVHSLHTAQPVQKAKADIYLNGDRELDCETDSQGYCFAKLDDNHKDSSEKKYLVHVQSDSDSAYIDSENFSQYISVRDGDTAYSGGGQAHVDGMVYFDRRLYRPGDTVHFKGILSRRKYGVQSAVSDEDIEFEIKDSQGETVYSDKQESSEEGGIHGTYEISKEAKLGHYTLAIQVKDSSRHSIEETFQVEEFRPVTFSVKSILPGSIKVNSTTNAVIEGKYLFGAPMGGAEVKYTVNRIYKSPYIEAYSDFTFGDDLRYEPGYNVSLETGYLTGGASKLDATGMYSFSFKAPPLLVKEDIDLPEKKSIKMTAPFELSFEASVKDADDRSVTNTVKVPVEISQGPIGIRANDRYKPVGSLFSFEILSLDTKGNKTTSRRDLTARVVHNRWKSVKVKGPENSMQVKNTLVRELVSETSVATEGDIANFTFSPEKSGEYSVTLQDQSGMAYARTMFYAYGKQSDFYVSDDDTLSISADKSFYNPGDTAKILVKSPYTEGTLIYTLEREKILMQKQMPIPGKTFVIEMPMKAEYLPNVYLSVGIIRGRTAMPEKISGMAKQDFLREDMGAPRLKFSSVNLKVNTSSRYASFSVASNRDSYSPRDNVVLDFTTEPGAEITVSVADRGVLDLISYSYEEPVHHFFRNWPLAVGLLENRRYLIRQFHPGMKGASPGGDGYGEAGGGGFSIDSEDGMRKDFRYTAFWKADIKANSQGKAKAEFQLPDNLTTFRIMAVSVRNGKYKSINKEFQVRKALVVQKLVPRFIRPGDSLEIGAVVINQTSADATFQTEMKSDLLGIHDSKQLQLKSGESKEVTFKASLNMKSYLQAKKKFDPEKAIKAEKPGVPAIEVVGYIGAYPTDKANLKAKGYKEADFQDKLKFTFPVYEMHPAEAFTLSGYTSSRQEEAVVLPTSKKALSGMGSLDMTLSSTALSGLENAFSFYASNPYYCLEQRASAYLLSLTSGDLLKEFGSPVPGQDGFDFTRIEQLFLEELKDFQNSNGAYRPWKEISAYDSSYLTTYISDVLMTAQEMGKKIPQDSLDKAMEYIATYLKSEKIGEYAYEAENLAYIAYLLSRKKMQAKGLLKALYKRKADLRLRAKAYLAMAFGLTDNVQKLGDSEEVSTLLDDIKRRMQVTTQSIMFQEEANSYFGSSYYTTGSTTAVILQALMMLDKDNPMIASIVNYLMNDRKATLWRDTHSSGKLAQALHTYHSLYEKTGTKNISAEIILSGKSLWSQKLEANKTNVLRKSIPLDNLLQLHKADTQLPLSFRNATDTGRMYYTAKLLYAPAAGAEKARDEGIEIHRRMYHVSISGGKQKMVHVPETRLIRGDLYLTRLSIINPKPYFNAVIVDPLASNIEIMNTAYATEAKPLAGGEEESDGPDESRHNRYYDHYGFVSHKEFRDDKVVLFSDYLYPGYHEFTYFARPIVKGKAARPGTQARLMYEPEIFGRSSANLSQVR